MKKLRTAMSIWSVKANDLIELAENAERAAVQIDERVLQRARELLETVTGWHNTLLHWEEQEAAPTVSADIRIIRGSLNAMRTEVDTANAKFRL